MGWSGCRDARSPAPKLFSGGVLTKALPEKSTLQAILRLIRVMSLLQGLYNIRLIAQRRKILHLRGRWDGPVVETQDFASLPRRIPKNASLPAILRLISVTLYCDI